MISPAMRRSFAVTLLFAVMCTTASYAAFEFPRPAGPYSVGTQAYHWVDDSRKELCAPQGTEMQRELVVQVWYPTSEKATAAKMPYLPHVMPHLKKRAAQTYPVPESVLNYLLGEMVSHALKDAPLLRSEGALPIIIFSHGLGSMSGLHTAQLENLASHGYVVFGINHSFMCSMTIFPDGRMFPFAFDWKASNKCALLNALVREWQGDATFVLDRVMALAKQEDSIFWGALDLQRIGMLGHSLGGATTTQMCRRDDRVKAGINMDGPLFGDDHTQAFNKPYLVMMAEASLIRAQTQVPEKELAGQVLTRDEEALLGNIFKFGIPQLCANIAGTGNDAYLLYFRGAGHHTFTDLPLGKKSSYWLFTFLQYNGLSLGSMGPDAALRNVNRYVVAFFDKYLCNKPSIYLERNAPCDNEIVVSRGGFLPATASNAVQA